MVYLQNVLWAVFANQISSYLLRALSLFLLLLLTALKGYITLK
jgi:hypothetical protein